MISNNQLAFSQSPPHDPDVVWLSISLFCYQAYWHILLEEGIAPFVKNMGYLQAYEIKLNHLGSHNVELGLLTECTNANLLAQAANEHFNIFFENIGFPYEVIKLPVKGVFQPFAMNSVKYGLFTREQRYSALSIGISRFMLEALKDEVNDDNAIISFAFYLHIGLIKTVNQRGITLTEIMQPAEIGQLNSISDNYRNKFEENNELLTEIIMDIVNGNEELPPWLMEWMSLCDEELALKHKNASVIFFGEVVRLIYQKMDIEDAVRLMLEEFILIILD
ncbi:hypothetical protein MUGA111182_17715 [Mucilaginibacter galii]|uniref:Uncharacterized protein n=1 Tax=Mucilaginibacter galii TaxID=2005073 RepID=A0A917JBG2_9SPHI|nr:hypothetical protein [Mucilaginibacter galii]GGI52273.1 hypothetical protein GCM10011425_34850 [Mucilaginibacter galii]